MPAAAPIYSHSYPSCPQPALQKKLSCERESQEAVFAERKNREIKRHGFCPLPPLFILALIRLALSQLFKKGLHTGKKAKKRFLRNAKTGK